MFGKIEDITFKVQKFPAYAIGGLLNKKEIPKSNLLFCGYSLLNLDQNLPLRTELNNFQFITNSDILNLVNTISPVNWKLIYYNNQKTEFYINGTFTNQKVILYSDSEGAKGALLGVEVSNSYSGIFVPRIRYSIAFVDKDNKYRFFRTTAPVFNFYIGDDQYTESDSLPTLDMSKLKKAIMVKPPDFTMIVRQCTRKRSVEKAIPKRYRLHRDSLLRKIGNVIDEVSFDGMNLLEVSAHIGDMWITSNYNKAREYQNNIYSNLFKGELQV